VIENQEGRIFVQRRGANRRLFPGCWDVVGGHVEAGESLREALAREILEETGWALDRVEAQLGPFRWRSTDGTAYVEVDYVARVHGNLAIPKLEEGKHDRYAWVTLDDLELLHANRSTSDQLVYQIVEAVLLWRSRLNATPPSESG
jgi:8-oxo-dGTP diphosphatase